MSAHALSLVALAIVVLVSKTSFAMLAVPMCGEHAETVIAPPISRAAPEIPLAATNCEQKSGLEFKSHPEKAPLRETHASEVVPRMPPVFYRLPPAPLATRLAPRAGASSERPGFRPSIERPPR